MDGSSRLDALKRIRLQAAMLQVGFASENIGEIIQCQEELDSLAERFLSEHGEMVEKEEWENARLGLDAFVALVEKTIERCTQTLNASPGTARQKPPSLG